MEGAASVEVGQGADGAVAFGPGGAFVGFEKAGFDAFVGWGGVVDVLGDGEGGWGGDDGGGVAVWGYGCLCGG